jgi:hypothetical protein
VIHGGHAPAADFTLYLVLTFQRPAQTLELGHRYYRTWFI